MRSTADEGLEVRFRATAGPHVVAVSFLDEPFEPEGVLQPELTGLGLAYSEFSSAPSGPWGPSVDTVSIDGPYDATGAGRLRAAADSFRAGPASPADEDGCARQILSTVARRGYRGPVDDKDVNRLLDFYRARKKDAGSFETGIQAAVERLLVDPRFLFRIERDPPDATRVPPTASATSSWRRVSRSSCGAAFPTSRCWRQRHAGHCAIRDAQAQVTRMIADGRARALVDNFAVQWLALRQLRPVTLDPEIFTEFDGNLRDAFLAGDAAVRRRISFATIGSVLDLLTANYTFVNERLARHYGIPGVYGSHFRQVTVGDDRAGLLGHGSILTATSYPTRTSPVLRGRWLLDNVLGTPPPPPPPDIPPLPPRWRGRRKR